MASRPLASRIETILAVALLLGSSTGAHARTAQLDQIQALADRGRAEEALRRLESLLVEVPDQLDGQLLRGTLLAELGRSSEAERAFRLLSRQYPEQPEPSHNLAVLQAWAGRPAMATRALEDLVDSHPTYETAASNLERIRAAAGDGGFDPLSADGSRLRLALTPRVRFSPPAAGDATQPAPVAAPTRSAAATREPLEEASPVVVTAEPAPTPQPQAAPPAPEPPSSPTPAAAIPPVVAAVEEPELEAPAAESEAAPVDEPARAASDRRAHLERVVAAWAAAWSEQRVKEYLAFYASDFRPAGYPSRAAWEAVRRQRVASPSFIEVEIDPGSMTVAEAGEGEASVSFVQGYRSDRYSDTVLKTLSLVLENGAWRIRSETSQ